jgi:hypothetical protein
VDVIDGRFDPGLVRDRIALLGVTIVTSCRSLP